MAARWSEGAPHAYIEGGEVTHRARELGSSLLAMCRLLYVASFLVGICPPRGPGQTEFCWNGLAVSAMRRHTGKAQRWGGGCGGNISDPGLSVPSFRDTGQRER